MYRSFAVGSHPVDCRHPAQVGCRWKRQSVEASSGPGSCAEFCWKTRAHVKGVREDSKIQQKIVQTRSRERQQAKVTRKRFLCVSLFRGVPPKLPAAHWRKNTVVFNGDFNCMVQKSVMFLIISFFSFLLPSWFFFVYRELFSSTNHFSSLNPFEYFKDDAA